MKTTNDPSKLLSLQKALRSAVVLVILAAVPCCRALTVLSGPYFTSATNAPLAGVLTLTTDTDSQVSVSVSDGTGTWTHDFYDYGTNHSETLLGFKANRTNEITVIARDKYRNTFTLAQTLTFVTSPLPPNMPTMVLLTNNPDLMEPGYTLFRVDNASAKVGYVTILDSSAQIVWYSSNLSTGYDIRQLPDGDLFFPDSNAKGLTEVNMLGQTVSNWTAPSGYSVNFHEDLMTDHGTILYLSYVTNLIADFPSSATVSNAPTKNTEATVGRVVEISATNSALLNVWSLLAMLDPVRIDYLCFLSEGQFGIDPEHANAIYDDTADDSIIASLRNQDAVVKFSRSGQLIWILGPPENWGPEWQPYLLTPVGTPFEWNYAQHAPVLTPEGTLLLYDDGNDRAEPFATPVPDQSNYSRAVEFSIDETNMTVSQVWQYSGTNDDRLYTSALGNANRLPQTGNVLVTFGYVSYENGVHPDPLSASATMARIKEVTHESNPEVVFDLEINSTNSAGSGYWVYRSYRIPDLYAHPALPVPNLTAQIQAGVPSLQFTADPALTYVVQTSSDSQNWYELGVASPDDNIGDFSFQDVESAGNSAQFYRVLTE